MKTAREFIEFYEEIAGDKWRTGSYGEDGVAHCAAGHLGRRPTFSGKLQEYTNLSRLFMKYRLPGIPKINDGRSDLYQQPNPKQRILAALHDIERLGG